MSLGSPVARDFVVDAAESSDISYRIINPMMSGTVAAFGGCR